MTCVAAPASVAALTAVGTTVGTAKTNVGIGIALEVVTGVAGTIDAATG